MADLAAYEALLADWRAKEDHAARMREFAATRGEHRMRVAIVQADPALAAAATPAFNDLMKGDGWRKLVDLGVTRAERAADRAKAALEFAAIEAAQARGAIHDRPL